MTDPDRWMSSKEASRSLSISVRTLYRLIDDGEIVAFKIGRVIRVRQVDLDAFVDGARIEPGALVHLYRTPLYPGPR